MILTPVLMQVRFDGLPPGSRRVQRRRETARAALRRCAARCGAPEGGWRQAEDGRPLRNGRWYWSIAHRGGWAAAVIGDGPVGIDVEVLKPRADEVFDETGRPEEWSVFGGRSEEAFFRLWTAKEAVLKTAGLGIGGWDRCHVKLALSPDLVLVMLDDRENPVEHFRRGDMVAAVTLAGTPAVWQVVD